MELLGFWWVMLLLLLDHQSSGTANIPSQNPRRHQVNGIQGGSVLLPVVLTSSERVAKIKWKFQPQTGLDLVIAEFTDGKLERPNPGDRFGRRLEMADEATLRIAELQLGDGGVYVARVRLASAAVEEHSFTCRVYEPVPEPQILLRLVSRTAEACNVTLQCLGSEKGGIEVSWKRGNQLGVLEEVSDRDRLSANGTDLHVSWRPDSLASTFSCLLSNPVDQKSASLDLVTICRSEEPVPEPQILLRLVSRTAEVCNVTLQCLGSERGGIEVSWKRGNQLGALEEVSDRDRLSANGSDLHVSWRPDSMDSTFSCLLSSPVDQKSASLDLASICQKERVSRCLSWVRVAMLVGVLVQILTVASLNVLQRIGQKQN